MSKILRHKDKDRSYELFFKDRILRARVVGSVGDSLSGHFHDDALKLITLEQANLWAYFGDLLFCDGATLQAEKMMIKVHNFGLVKSCCADAYLFAHR